MSIKSFLEECAIEPRPFNYYGVDPSKPPFIFRPPENWPLALRCEFYAPRLGGFRGGHTFGVVLVSLVERRNDEERKKRKETKT